MVVQYGKQPDQTGGQTGSQTGDPKGALQGAARSWRGLLWPAIFTAAALVVLIGLGNWQMQRLAWKNALSEHIQSRLKAPPVSLNTALTLHKHDPESAEYSRVKLAGEFLHDLEIHLYSSRKKQVGWNIYTPLKLDDGRIVLVNRGFVPQHLKDQQKRTSGLLSGKVELVGLLRTPRKTPGLFTPDNNIDKNRWFWIDLPDIAKFRLAGDAKMLPVTIDAEASDLPGGWPQGGTTRLVFENRHFEYAMTWYGLAASLLGVFAFFAWGRLRS